MGRRGVVAVIVAAIIGVVAWLPRATPTLSARVAAAAGDADDDPGRRRRADRPRERVLLGEVVDGDGRAIAGASVAVVVGDREVRRTVTDDEGRFSFDALPADIARLAFSAEGYLTVHVEGTALPTQTEAFWSQTLHPAPGRRLVLVRSGNDVVSGARIFRADRLPTRAAEALAVSDDRGRAFVGADLDDVALIAAHPAHGAVRVEGDVAVLPAAARLQVRVVDERRAPVAGARVLVRAVPPTGTDPLALALRLVQGRLDDVRTDDDGRADWRVPDGDVVVEVVAAGYRPARREERARRERPGVVEIRLATSPIVTGVVVDADSGEAIAGASVRGDAGGRLGAEAITDEDGRFELTGLDARPSSLTVRKRGYQTLTIGGVDGAASRLEAVRLELHRGRGDQVVGIGVSIGLQDDRVTIHAVEPGSPAEAAGLVAGEVIVAVDGVALGSDLAEVTGRIRGQPGTPVRLGIVDENGARRDVEIERAVIAVRARGRRR
jgi:membrane-associated protease RseP (regulator of RpoE activity)